MRFFFQVYALGYGAGLEADEYEIDVNVGPFQLDDGSVRVGNGGKLFWNVRRFLSQQIWE